MAIPAALLAATGVAGALGIGQAIAGAKPTETDIANKKRLEELRRLQERGQLGLGGDEERLLGSRLTAPVQRAAGEAQRRAEAVQAAAGGTSAADLSRLRQEQSRTVSAGRRAAAEQVEAADIAARRAQEAEIEQRTAAVSQRQRDVRTAIFDPLIQTAGALGQVAGSPPETLRAASLFGAPVRDPNKLVPQLVGMGISPERAQELADMERRNPGSLTRLINQAQAQSPGLTNPTLGPTPETAAFSADPNNPGLLLEEQRRRQRLAGLAGG